MGKFFANVVCPYCGLQMNGEMVEASTLKHKHIMRCDLDKGGCDRDFVIETYLEVHVKSLKIEGVV